MECPDLFLGTLSIKWYYWGRCCFWVKDWEQGRGPPFYRERSQKKVKSQRNLPTTQDQKSISNRRNCKFISGSKCCTKTILDNFSENHRLAILSNSRKHWKTGFGAHFCRQPWYPSIKWTTPTFFWELSLWNSSTGEGVVFGWRIENRVVDHHFIESDLKKSQIPEKPANHTGPKIHFK